MKAAMQVVHELQVGMVWVNGYRAERCETMARKVVRVLGDGGGGGNRLLRKRRGASRPDRAVFLVDELALTNGGFDSRNA